MSSSGVLAGGGGLDPVKPRPQEKTGRSLFVLSRFGDGSDIGEQTGWGCLVDCEEWHGMVKLWYDITT